MATRASPGSSSTGPAARSWRWSSIRPGSATISWRCKSCLWLGGGRYRPDGALHYPASHGPRAERRGTQLADVFPCTVRGKHPGHEHAKPLIWLQMLLANCTSGPVVDPFGGAGTTMVAAHMLGRPSVTVEIDRDLCEAMVEQAARTTRAHPERIG